MKKDYLGRMASEYTKEKEILQEKINKRQIHNL